ncbi:MAG: T9SS type A sorting domain-containing protein [Chitinophagaceae bacterium]
MKKIQLVLMALVFATTGVFAQTAYNPFTQNIHFVPEPTAFGFECGTTPEVVFTMGLTTQADATDVTNPLGVIICIGGFNFEGTDITQIVSGSYASNFDWEIDSFAPNCIVGTQKQTLEGTGTNPLFPNPNASGEIRIKLQVPETSPIGTVLSVNVNLQVPGYMQQFNSQPDDNESTTTQTFCPLRIVGTLYHDTSLVNPSIYDGNKPFNNPNDTLVYAYLIGPGGDVEQIVPIDSNGTYQFTNVSPNTTYTVLISTVQGTVGAPPPPVTLPTGWSNTGEDCCDKTGNDGIEDGTIVVNVTNATLINVDFGIYNPNPTGPLPTIYKEFNVTEHNCNVILTWMSEQEINSSHIDVLRKDEANGSYKKISEIKAAGNSQITKSYSYVDNTVSHKETPYSYQLRFVDIDQKYTLSEEKTVNVQCDKADANVAIFPNPAKDGINIVFSAEEAGAIFEADLVDVAGRKIAHQGIELVNGNNVISFNTKSLAVGSYFIRYSVSDGGTKGSIKFSKN